MDPALWELMEGDENGEVEAIIKLREGAAVPPGVRIVSRFGEIATCRLRRGDIQRVRRDGAVISLKAPRPLEADVWLEPIYPENPSEDADYLPRRPAVPETGAGVVVGVVDWGCDFAHPHFRNPDGSTRLIALWDQRGQSPVTPENPYGRGRIHLRPGIDAALRSADPYQTLGYHPADSDGGMGSHGTHVMSIAAGNGAAEGAPGMAPGAELIFVHMSGGGTGGLATFGDSVALLEAVDFISRTAGARPCAINISMGQHGGPHDGTTLVEQGLDGILENRSNLAIINSAGNYYTKRIHASGRLVSGVESVLPWAVNPADSTANELEVWYSSRDGLEVEMRDSSGLRFGPVALGGRLDLRIGGRLAGRIYHRANDPNNGDHHVDIFLYPGGSAARWEVALIPRTVTEGRFHAWIERDSGSAVNQSSFEAGREDSAFTTGTIANGRKTIAVGAYDGSDPARSLVSFSSSGPTRDGRRKPDLAAPGSFVTAARSAPRGGPAPSMLTRMRGTSMAAPHVTGTAALMLQAAGAPLSAEEIRDLLTRSCDAHSLTGADADRAGAGYLNSLRAVNAARGRRASGAAAPVRHNIRAQSAAARGSGAYSGRRYGDVSDPAAPEREPGYAQALAERVKNHASGGDMEKIETESAEEIMESAWVSSVRRPAPSPAALFDAITAPRDSRICAYAEQAFTVLAYPGQKAPDNLLPGDLVIVRALGEGGIGFAGKLDFPAHPSLLENYGAEPARGAMARLDPSAIEVRFPRSSSARSRPFSRFQGEGGRLKPDALLLRPGRGWSQSPASLLGREGDGQEVHAAENPALAALPVIISGAELGLSAFTALRTYVFDGSFKVTCTGGSYIHPHTPPGLTERTKIFSFCIGGKNEWTPDEKFYFTLTLSYDGANVLHANIIEDRNRSSTLVASRFEIEFTARPANPATETITELRFDFTGRWDRAGSGDYNFGGVIKVNSLGEMPVRRMDTGLPEVFFDGPTTSRGGGSVPRPRPVTQFYSVYFEQTGSTRLSEEAIRGIHAWYSSLSGVVRRTVADGNLPIYVKGFASRIGTMEANRRIANQRAANVRSLLTQIAGDRAVVNLMAVGSLEAAAATRSGQVDDQRVDMEIRYIQFS